MTPPKGPPRWSEKDLASYQARRGVAAGVKKAEESGNVKNSPSSEHPASLHDALAKFNLGNNKAVKKDSKTSGRAKRRGVNTAPIFATLKASPARAAWGEDWLAVNMPDARLLSYNELFSILQHRRWEAYRYKKLCRKILVRALDSSETLRVKRPFFDTPTRLTLVRVGSKRVDVDAMAVMFKYLTDALRRCKIIEDDNPLIISEPVIIQDIGPERLMMRLDRLKHWREENAPDWAAFRAETPALLDCPFCGRKVDDDLSDTLYPTGTRWRDDEQGRRRYLNRRDAVEGDGTVWMMSCPQSGGGCGAEIFGDSEEEAREAWNRRP